MEVRQSILLSLGCLLLLGGCNLGRNNAALERELRMQEDRIYQLQDCLQETQTALEACCQENESLRRGLAGDRAPDYRQSQQAPPKRTGLSVELPSSGDSPGGVPSMLRGGASADQPSSGAGSSGGGYQITPGYESPPSSGPAEPGAVPRPPVPGTLNQGSATEGPSIDTAAMSEAAARVEVGQLLVERPDEGEGISLVVVPRDERGEPLVAPAPVSVVVIDPAFSGPEARVARWDFTPEQIAALIDPAEVDEGFRLRLRWPRQGPAHKELHLFVRYQTIDGRKLHAETPFDLGRLAVAEPRRIPRSTASWQRKLRPTPRQEVDAPAAPPWPGNGPAMTEAPSWGATTADRRASQAPPWQGTPSDSPTVADSRIRPAEEVTSRPERPTWSPERR